jgi:hypothetical protein
MVEFKDGEVLFGYTLTYTSQGIGFFVFPGDPESNNEKVFVIHAATPLGPPDPADGKLSPGFPASADPFPFALLLLGLPRDEHPLFNPSPSCHRFAPPWCSWARACWSRAINAALDEYTTSATDCDGTG